MANPRIANLSVEHASIIFKNFAGKEKAYNPAGKRNFCLLVDNIKAEELKAAGWNIKYLKPRDEDELPQAYMQVAVAFENFPPNIWLISGGKKTKLTEETVAVLDYAEIENVDVIISPYHWEAHNKSGIKAYVKNLYVTVAENEFEKKYRNMDEEEEDDGELPF